MPYSVIFAGTPEFAVPSLNALIHDPDFDVKLVISQPDKPIGRKQEVLPTPVKNAAQKKNIPVWQPVNLNAEWKMQNAELHSQFSILNSSFDYLVVVAYGQILKEHVLSAPHIAPVNLHASLLPRWRGASPMQSALLHGDAKTGVTIQRIVKELDAGPILGKRELKLAGTETITYVHDTLADMGAALLVDLLKQPLTEELQDTQAITTCHKLTKEMGVVDCSTMTATDIDRRVRALVPWPGVRISINDEDVKLLTVSLTETADSVALPCKDSVIHLVTVQPAGKKPMCAKDWQRGRV